ncbi:MAG: hypothetical protein HUJ75_04710, partial [Parasporobacterium sp.]|nr:hypothetical protein [Parasporobacterium sp.]
MTEDNSRSKRKSVGMRTRARAEEQALTEQTEMESVFEEPVYEEPAYSEPSGEFYEDMTEDAYYEESEEPVFGHPRTFQSIKPLTDDSFEAEEEDYEETKIIPRSAILGSRASEGLDVMDLRRSTGERSAAAEREPLETFPESRVSSIFNDEPEEEYITDGTVAGAAVLSGIGDIADEFAEQSAQGQEEIYEEMPEPSIEDDVEATKVISLPEADDDVRTDRPRNITPERPVKAQTVKASEPYKRRSFWIWLLDIYTEEIDEDGNPIPRQTKADARAAALMEGEATGDTIAVPVGKIRAAEKAAGEGRVAGGGKVDPSRVQYDKKRPVSGKKAPTRKSCELVAYRGYVYEVPKGLSKKDRKKLARKAYKNRHSTAAKVVKAVVFILLWIGVAFAAYTGFKTARALFYDVALQPDNTSKVEIVVNGDE